jgi:hypothetical protein
MALAATGNSDAIANLLTPLVGQGGGGVHRPTRARSPRPR